MVDRLTDSEREQLRRAVQEVWQDPAVVAKRRELQLATQAFRAALKEAIDKQEDGDLKRVMTRLLAERYLQETRPGQAAPPRVKPDRPAGTAVRPSDVRKIDVAPDRVRPVALLTAREQAVLSAAREKAMTHPRVAAAIKRREAATDHEAKMLGARDYREAMRAAMVAANPAVETILKKLEAGGGTTDRAPSDKRPRD